MKKYQSWWLVGLLTFLWALNTIMWSPQLSYISYPANNLHAIILQVIHSITIIGFLLCVMWCGDFLSRQKSSLARTVKLWLFIAGITLLAVLGKWLVFNHFTYTSLYSALLPLTQNTAPLATAFLLASLLLPWLKNQVASQATVVSIALLIPMAITTAFNRDAFGLLNGTSVTFYLIVMALGSLTDTVKLTRKNWWTQFLIWTGINLILVGMMPNVSFQLHHSMVTANRFTTPASLVIVIITFLCYQVIRPFLNRIIVPRPTYFWLALTVFFSDATITSGFVTITRLTSNWGLQVLTVLILTIAALIMALFLPQLFNWLQRIIKLGDRVDAFLTFDHSQSTNQQLVTLGKRTIGSLVAHWLSLLSLGLSYLLADLSIYYMGNHTHFVKQTMLWLTTILVFLIFKALQAVFNRYWIALLTTTTFMAIWTVGNTQKMELRNEPILPSDLSMIDDLDSLLKMIDVHLVILSGFAIVIVIIAMIILEHRIKGQRLSLKWRICWLLLAICVFGSSAFWNHHESRMQTLMTGLDDQPHFIHQAVGAKQNGPTVQFLNNVDITIMERPRGYSKAAMIKLAHHYQAEAAEINQHRANQLKNQTIIFNLSESFANPNRVPGVTLKKNPIPKIDRLKGRTTSGIMISSGYGGGTADMEYMTLTGFAMCNFAQTLSTPFTQLVPYLKHNPTIVQSFKYAAAIHPYSNKFYDRSIDYPKFGFAKFSYLGSKKYPIKHQHTIHNNPYMSDQTAYANLLDQLNTHHGPQFINLVTMQNHLPYVNLYKDSETDQYRPVKISAGTDPHQVANYATGIHYTDNDVARFIKQIDHINRPITIVFYGDHLPGIYRNNMKVDGLKLHETDYFIYSNPAARRLGARKLTKSTHYVGPNDFIAMAAEQTNSKVTPYQALLTQLYHYLPAYALSTQQNGTNSFNSAPEYVNQHGKIVSAKTFNKRQKRLWHDYQLVQYDITAGHHYLLHTKMMK